MQDLISIIIPCYNAEDSISRTLNSVREQDYKNLEIIIINDGSNDNSVNIINKFVKIDKRIKLIDQNNLGVSAARNNGLKNAKGNYIVFLDADDNYTTPYAISSMMNHLKKAEADMCVCNFTHPCFEQYIEAGVYDLLNKNEFLKFYQDFFAFGMPWNKITKRECLTEKFVEGVKFTEDEIFNLFNLKNLKKVVVVDKVYHNYYCAPYNPKEKARAVNSIYSKNTFNKNTIWYQAMNTNELRNFAIETYFPNMKEDMQYVRVFDFFFWDFFLMAKNAIPEKLILKNCEEIFKEQIFIDALKDKQRYGLTLNITKKGISDFVNFAYIAFKDIKNYNKDLSMFKVFLALFGHCFYEPTNAINDVDILANMVNKKINNSNAEAIYVNNLLFNDKQ